MRSGMLAKFSNCFLFLAVGILVLFSPFIGKAQSSSTENCEMRSYFVWETVPESYYNPNTQSTETRYTQKQVLKWQCVPVAAETNSATLGGRNSSHPNTVRDADGTLRPANGYRWVNSKPGDFRVELIPGLIKTEDGFRPASGYQWVNSKDPKDFRVERIP